MCAKSNTWFLGLPPNGMSIGLAVFVVLTGLPYRQTDIDNGTCDMCSNRPQLCDACDAAMEQGTLKSIPIKDDAVAEN